MQFTLITLIVSLCFLASLFLLRKKQVGWWKYFRWFLLLTTLVEGTGYCLYFIFHIKNHWLFNLFLPVEYLFYSWILYQLNKPYFNSKPWIASGLTAVLAIYLYESLSAGFKAYSTNATVVASIYFTVMCCVYFYHFLRHDKYVQLLSFPPFWIVAGLFIFYFCSTGINFFFDYLSSTNAMAPQQLKLTRYYIYIVLNFILYSSWTYAFICKHRQTT